MSSKYECKRCHYTTTNKSSYSSHLNTKKHINNFIDIEKLYKLLNEKDVEIKKLKQQNSDYIDTLKFIADQNLKSNKANVNVSYIINHY